MFTKRVISAQCLDCHWQADDPDEESNESATRQARKHVAGYQHRVEVVREVVTVYRPKAE